jgi:hypothetical protein
MWLGGWFVRAWQARGIFKEGGRKSVVRTEGSGSRQEGRAAPGGARPAQVLPGSDGAGKGSTQVKCRRAYGGRQRAEGGRARQFRRW